MFLFVMMKEEEKKSRREEAGGGDTNTNSNKVLVRGEVGGLGGHPRLWNLGTCLNKIVRRYSRPGCAYVILNQYLRP